MDFPYFVTKSVRSWSSRAIAMKLLDRSVWKNTDWSQLPLDWMMFWRCLCIHRVFVLEPQFSPIVRTENEIVSVQSLFKCLFAQYVPTSYTNRFTDTCSQGHELYASIHTLVHTVNYTAVFLVLIYFACGSYFSFMLLSLHSRLSLYFIYGNRWHIV